MLVHGNKDGKAHLAKALHAVARAVHCPSRGESVDVSSTVGVAPTELAHELYSELQFQPVPGAGCDLAFVEAEWQAGVMKPTALHKPSKPADGHLPVLVRAQPLWLHEVKRKLTRKGVKADFVDGVLVTPGGVRVSKVRNELKVDGPLVDEYFAVREVLSTLFTAV